VLIRPCGSNYWIVFQAERIQLKRHTRMIMMHHLGWVGLIERVFVQVRIMVRVVGYHNAVHGWYLRGEVRRSLPGLLKVSTYRKWRCFKKQPKCTERGSNSRVARQSTFFEHVFAHS